MALIDFKFIKRLLTPTPVNAPLAEGDRLDEALNKLQGQINSMGEGGAVADGGSPSTVFTEPHFRIDFGGVS